jgi:hypothetical protein
MVVVWHGLVVNLTTCEQNSKLGVAFQHLAVVLIFCWSESTTTTKRTPASVVTILLHHTNGFGGGQYELVDAIADLDGDSEERERHG